LPTFFIIALLTGLCNFQFFFNLRKGKEGIYRNHKGGLLGRIIRDNRPHNSGGHDMYCTKCGKSYQADFKKCPYCNKQETKTAPVQDNFGNYRDRANLRFFQFKQADFALRMAAMMIDLIILLIPSVLLIVFAKAIGVIICIILGWAYYALLESSSLQGTIGKFALKLEVTDLEGQPLDLLQATKRYFAHYLSILTLGAGFIILAFNDKKQAVHDLLTDCMVLDAVQQNKNNNGHILEKNY
jgi:uncharacterized RDD family membrane protein YckC